MPRIRSIILVFLFIALLVAGAGGAPLRLMTGIPTSVPHHPVVLASTLLSCPPVVDAEGKLLVVWRSISAVIGRFPVVSLYLQKLDPAGQRLWSGVPRVLAQTMARTIDIDQSSALAAVVADKRGGFFTLMGGHVLHFDRTGTASWPKGEAMEGRPGPLWRYPSAVRIPTFLLTESGIDNRDNCFVPDGRGGALAVFNGVDNFQVQRLDTGGKHRWGLHLLHGKILADNKETGHYGGKVVSDGAGGFVALLKVGEYGSECTASFHNDSGVRTAASRPLAVDVDNARVAPDGAGGMFVLYLHPAYEPNGLLTHKTVKLLRIGAGGRIVFDRQLGTDKFRAIDHFYLRSFPGGSAVAHWRRTDAEPNSDEERKTPTRLFVARVEADGREPWGRPLALSFPSVVGKDGCPNRAFDLDVLAIGNRTWLAYEQVVTRATERRVKGHAGFTDVDTNVYLQVVGADGTLRHAGIGKQCNPADGNGGHTPYLVEFSKRPALVYYSQQGLPGGGPDWPIPFFMFLDKE